MFINSRTSLVTTAIAGGTARFKPNIHRLLGFTKQMPYLVGLQGSNRFYSGEGYGNPKESETGIRADT